MASESAGSVRQRQQVGTKKQGLGTALLGSTDRAVAAWWLGWRARARAFERRGVSRSARAEDRDWLNGGMGAGMVLRAEAVLIWDDGDEIGRGDCDEQRWVKVEISTGWWIDGFEFAGEAMEIGEIGMGLGWAFVGARVEEAVALVTGLLG
ncbi:hypothetical protein M0R45_020244 [Rubus argutus]|uniref:Uncharacterized protein n=1 Tax=Rubus argutus TaxID=59490 RepID=A0AAW1X7R9_RUBAR